MPPQEMQHPSLRFIFAEKAALFLTPLDQAKTEGALREGITRLQNSFVGMVDELNKIPSKRVACKPGCNYCCTIRVTCSAGQVLVLAKYLKRTLSPEALEALLARIAEYEAETATLTPLQQVLRVTMCPLNVDGLCIGYPARPISCSGYHSFDVEKCREDYADPNAEVTVPQDPQRWAYRSMHIEALSAGMEALGLDSTELELIPALRIALLDDEAGTKYMNGEPVFAEADMPEVKEEQSRDLDRRGMSFGGLKK